MRSLHLPAASGHRVLSSCPRAYCKLQPVPSTRHIMVSVAAPERQTSGAVSLDNSVNPIVAAVKPSKTMALTDLATSMREQGVDVIGLAAGEPDFDTPAEIVAAGIEALQKGITRYTPNTGTTALRKAICKKLKDDNGLEYSPDEIVVSNGAKQAIWQAVLATVSPGDEVMIPAPYWVSYTEMATLAGAKPVVIPTTSEEGFILSADKLRAALTPKSRVLILCTPSNPTGAVYTKYQQNINSKFNFIGKASAKQQDREQLEAIAEVVREHPRLLVISDEIYEYIIYKPAQHHSFGALPGMWERTLTVNGFSKAYAMTGWRLGYLAGPKHFIKAAAIIQSQSTSGASSIAQHAAIAALGLGPGGGEPVQNMLKAFQSRRDMIVAKFRSIPGVKLAAPEGAFYVLPEMSAFFGPGAEAKEWGPVPDSDAFCRYLIEVANVAVVPGDAFGADACIRISYAASIETLEKAMNCIIAALDPSVYTRRTGA